MVNTVNPVALANANALFDEAMKSLPEDLQIVYLSWDKIAQVIGELADTRAVLQRQVYDLQLRVSQLEGENHRLKGKIVEREA